MLDEVMMEQNGASPSSSSSLAPSGRPQNAEHDARDPSPSKRDFPHGFCAWGTGISASRNHGHSHRESCRGTGTTPRSGETSEQQTCPCCPGLPAVGPSPNPDRRIASPPAAAPRLLPPREHASSRECGPSKEPPSAPPKSSPSPPPRVLKAGWPLLSQLDRARQKGEGHNQGPAEHTQETPNSASNLDTHRQESSSFPRGLRIVCSHVQVLQQPPLPARSRSYRHADLCEHHKRAQFPVTKSISPLCMALSRSYPSPKHTLRCGTCRARSPTCCRRCNGLPSCQATHPGHSWAGPFFSRPAQTDATLSLSCATWHDCSSPARSPQTSNPTVGIMRIDGIPAAVCPSGHSSSRGT